MTTLAERLQELRLQEYNVLHGPPNTGESLGKNQTLNNEFATTNNEYLGELTSPFKPLNKETKVLTATPLTTEFVQKLKTEQTSTTSKFAHSVAPDFGVTNPMLSNPGTPSGLAAAIDEKNANNLQLIAEAKSAADAKVIQSSMDDEQSTNAKTQNLAEANAAIATAQAATEQKRKDILAVKNIEADEKFANYTGPEVPKTLSSDTSDIPDEYVLRGEAEDGGDLYLKSNGKSYDEVLKEYKAANGEEVSGAFFTKNAEDIIGNDRVSNEQREYLESGEALLPDGSYEPTEGRDFHAHLGEKQEIEAKAKAQQKRFETILDRQDDELHGGEIAAKNNYDKMNLEAYKKLKEEEKLAAGRQRSHDRFQNDRIDKIAEESDKAADANRYANQFNDSQNTETESKNYFEVGEKAEDSADAIAEVERNGIGFTNDEITAQAERESYLNGLGERLEAERHGGEKEASLYQKRREILERQAEENTIDGVLSGEKDAQQLHKLTEIKNKLDEERTGGDREGELFAGSLSQTNLGQRQNERLDDIKFQESVDKAQAASKSSDQVIREQAYQKRISLATKLKEKEIELYRNQINNPTADDIAGESDFYDKQRGTSGRHQAGVGHRGKFRNTFKQGADDPFAFSTLAYPRNLTNSPQIGHYLLFYVNVQNKTGYKYEGVTPSDGDFSVGDIVETQRKHYDTAISTGAAGQSVAEENVRYKTSYHYDKGANKGEIGYQERQVLSGGTGNRLRWNQKILSKGRKVLTGMKSVHKTTTRITDSVALYMPSASNNTSVQYQDFETGMAGYLALGGKGILDKILNNDYEGAASKFMGMGGTVMVEMLKKVGVEAVSAFTGANGVQQAFDKAFGQTLNPYLEVAFQSMGVRTFSYTFNFTPRNEEESLDVKDIIQLFRFHMVPELKGSEHRYLTLPSTFDIHYMYQSSPETAKENTFLSKIATCVLTKCDVDYMPDGVKSFDSGAPAAQTMTLEFMETEMLTKEKIQGDKVGAGMGSRHGF